MEPHYDDGETAVHLGDCLEVMRHLPDASVDAIVTDPPYGLGFMGKAWDALPPGLDFAVEAFRVLKPGGHILAFGGSRTWHRLAVAIEDAGFELRDSIAWLYGSGFPKSHDVSKAIDKAAGAEREVMGRAKGAGSSNTESLGRFAPEYDSTAPATPDAEKWQGWGTALKPAFEPVVVGRKPLAGTVAANILAHGVGALNIDATRVGSVGATTRGSQAAYPKNTDGTEDRSKSWARTGHEIVDLGKGRWPANVILDEHTAAELDIQAPRTGAAAKASGPSKVGRSERGSMSGHFNGTDDEPAFYGDRGGASRFFYVAKAPKSERPVVDGIAHPTVKPLELMRWLIRLVVPTGATILEPFAGSGTTVEAAILEGVKVIAIEREADYWPLIRHRIARGNDVL